MASLSRAVFFFVCCGAYAAWKVAYAVVFCLELLTRVVTQGFFTSRSEEVSFEATLFIVPEVASLPFILAFCGFISFHFGLLWLHLLLWGDLWLGLSQLLTLWLGLSHYVSLEGMWMNHQLKQTASKSLSSLKQIRINTSKCTNNKTHRKNFWKFV